MSVHLHIPDRFNLSSVHGCVSVSEDGCVVSLTVSEFRHLKSILRRFPDSQMALLITSDLSYEDSEKVFRNRAAASILEKLESVVD